MNKSFVVKEHGSICILNVNRFVMDKSDSSIPHNLFKVYALFGGVSNDG